MRSIKSKLTFLLILANTAPAAWSEPAAVNTPGTMAIAPAGITYFAAAGDTLTSIAQNLTGNGNNWIALGKLNRIANDRTIPVGSAIAIPLTLLPDEPGEAKVVAFAGVVTAATASGAAAPVAIGTRIAEGSQINTGNNGFLTLSLADGSHISLPSNSQIRLSKLRMARYTRSPRTEITLIGGHVESQVAPLSANKGRFEVRSTLATAGVRGTHFRVGMAGDRIANTVLSGAVAVGSPARPASLTLAAGSGNIIDATTVGKPVALLAAPALAADGSLQERPTILFSVQALDGAAAYHAQIARDKNAIDVLAEIHSQGRQLKVDGIPDGDYFARISAIAPSGLEGIPGIFPFKLKARPVPPFSSQPQSKVRAEQLEFSWIEAPDAQAYHLQVAKDVAFEELLIDAADVRGLQFSSDKLPPGKYFWRTASIARREGTADHGPFGETRSFDLMPAQKMAQATDNGGNELSFSWPSEPGQKFLLQIGRDAAFSSLLHSTETMQPEARIARPEVGTYFVRVKATDADGYVGAFSATQKITIDSRWQTGSGAPLQSGGSATRAGF